MIKLQNLLNILPITTEIVIVLEGDFIFKGTALECYEHLDDWFDLEITVLDVKENIHILKAYE